MDYVEPTMMEGIIGELAWNLPIIAALLALGVVGLTKMQNNKGLPAFLCAMVGLACLAVRVVTLFVLDTTIISAEPVAFLAGAMTYDDFLVQVFFSVALFAGVISLVVDLD